MASKQDVPAVKHVGIMRRHMLAVKGAFDGGERWSVQGSHSSLAGASGSKYGSVFWYVRFLHADVNPHGGNTSQKREQLHCASVHRLRRDGFLL